MDLYTFSELTRVKTLADVSYADGFGGANHLIRSIILIDSNLPIG